MNGNPKCDQVAPSAAEPLRRYTNFFEIQFSISEVELRFAQNFGSGHEAVVHSWLVTTPVHLAELAMAVNGAIASYQRRFGAIPVGDSAEQGG